MGLIVITLQDIAKATGVTVSTVSYALSGRGSISDATRERIIRCAEELGYQPNLIARGLVTQRTRTIGLIVADIANPFYGAVAQVVERVAHHADYRVFCVNTDRDVQLGQELLADLVARRVDGILALPGGLLSDTVRLLVPAKLPVVWCMWDEQGVDLVPSVGLDFSAGGRQVAEHLVALGHRRLAIVMHGAEPERSLGHSLRLLGFRTGMARAGLPLDPAFIHTAFPTIDGGRVAAHDLFELPAPPTAIFATNDLMAIGVLRAAKERRLSVPRDLSLVGFDDIVGAAELGPPLTTVHIDVSGMMTAATELLLRAMAGPVVTAPPLFMPRLVVRDSTSPPLSSK